MTHSPHAPWPRLAAWISIPLLAVVLGCDRGVSRRELGEVIFTDPEVPGSRDPYPLPKLEEPNSPPDGKAK